jgi:hypothetical protein
MIIMEKTKLRGCFQPSSQTIMNLHILNKKRGGGVLSGQGSNETRRNSEATRGRKVLGRVIE